MVDEKAETLAARVTKLEEKHAESLRIISELVELLATRIERLEMLNPYKA